MSQIVYFDAKLRTRRRGVIPYWDQTYIEDHHDGDLVWFHDGYGAFHLYRLEFAGFEYDCEVFIAVDMRRSVYNNSDDFKSWISDPRLALRDGSDIPMCIRILR